MARLIIRERSAGEVTILDMRGDLAGDESNVLLRTRLQRLLAEGKANVLLNLTDVSYIDSIGIGELISSYAAVNRFGGQLKLLNLTQKIQDQLTVTKLLTVFDIYDSEAEALSAWAYDVEPVEDSLRSADRNVSDDEFEVADHFPEEERAEDIIRRIPHMDILPDAELQPGTRLDVSVFVDNKPERPGEESYELTIEASPGIQVFETQVRLLATPHFIIDDQHLKSITVHREKAASNSANFKVIVKNEGDLPSETKHLAAGLTAVFSYGGRLSGRVRRKVQIAGLDDQAADPDYDTPREDDGAKANERNGQFRIDPFAKPADLTVEVTATPDNDGRHFSCTVVTPLLPQYANGVTGVWNLPDVAANIVNDYMLEFTTEQMSKEQRLASLVGAGLELFDAAPAVFKEVFWELVDANWLPRTISIVSEEPYIPWELMIPNRKRNGKHSERQALGVEFIIGRWTTKSGIAGLQKVPMTDCYVIAPIYITKPCLKYAQEEAAFLLTKFPAPAGSVIEPADFHNLAQAFGIRGKTIVHFACHGSVEHARQVIYLENEVPLSATIVKGIAVLRKAFEDKQPFVFLNACEVGRQVPTLVGVGGFAQSFIDLGARAVIAPLWSVKDDLAHQIAVEFYNSLEADPTRQFADIMRSIRARAYDPQNCEDTYAAYCFYGDPLSSAS